MTPLRMTLISMLFALSGCASMSYTLVSPGPVMVGDLQINAADAWNRTPSFFATRSRARTEVWTQDGVLLDRIVIIPGVPDGEPIFRSNDPAAALPEFRADMLPNELEGLTESSIVKLMGEGNVSVSTSNLRPNRYGEYNGVLMDIDAALSDGPDYRGLAGAFVADDLLFIMIYVAAIPYYYDKHIAKAEAVIQNAIIVRESGG